MLVIGLNIGKERYGIEAIRVTEIVPLIKLKKIPLTDDAIKGLFNYRGIPTPVIDLCQLFEKRSCNSTLSTRIVIIEHVSQSGTKRPLGLVAEKVTDVMKCNADELSDNGMQSQQNDFLGKVFKHNNELVQIIDTSKILPESISLQITEQIN